MNQQLASFGVELGWSRMLSSRSGTPRTRVGASGWVGGVGGGNVHQEVREHASGSCKLRRATPSLQLAPQPPLVASAPLPLQQWCGVSCGYGFFEQVFWRLSARVSCRVSACAAIRVDRSPADERGALVGKLGSMWKMRATLSATLISTSALKRRYPTDSR